MATEYNILVFGISLFLSVAWDAMDAVEYDDASDVMIATAASG